LFVSFLKCIFHSITSQVAGSTMVILHIFDWLLCHQILPSSIGPFQEERPVEALEGNNPWDHRVCLREKMISLKLS